MANCSNPVQCQMAKRPLCTCDCKGSNHSILRLKLEDSVTHNDAVRDLEALRQLQANLKKDKKKQRRENRAAEKRERVAV